MPPPMDERIVTAAELAEDDALCRARAIHSDPEAPLSAEQQPLPAGVKRRPVKGKSPAEWAYERVILYLRNFEAGLDEAQEVAMGFAGSAAGVLRIEGVGFFAPDLLAFYGRDAEGRRTQLVQHVSQLNFLLRAMPKEPDREAPRRVGFHLAAALEDEAGGS